MRSRVITERHVGTVTDNADPEFRGRLKVRCDTLLATGQEFPFWIEPSPIALAGQADGTTDAGVWYLPTAGTPVVLHVTVGHELDEVPGETAVAGPEVRWSPSTLTDLDSFPTPLLTNYPERRGWVTPRGSGFFFDDTDEAEVFAVAVDEGDGVNVALAIGAIGAAPEFPDYAGARGILAGDLTPGASAFLFLGSDYAAGEAVLETESGVQVRGSGANLHLNDSAGTAQGVARINDTVGPDTGMSTWMTQVATAINTLVPGSVSPAFPADFGVITGGSATVKAGG